MNRWLPSPLRLVLLAVAGTAALVTLGLIFGATSASAADDPQNDSAPGTSLLGAVTQPLVSDVVAVVPQVATVVTDVAAAQPASEIVDPVAELADSIVVEVPIVGDVASDVLGDAPVQSVTTPITDVVDNGVGTVAGIVSDTSGTTVNIVDSALPHAEVPTVQPDPETIDSVSPVTTDLSPAAGSATDPTVNAIQDSVRLTTTDLLSDAATSVLVGTTPDGAPLRSPAPENSPLAVLPAQSGSSAGAGGATGGMFVADTSTMSLVPDYSHRLLFASADEIVPSFPTFDPGCTPD